jgi:hypothetical protein
MKKRLTKKSDKEESMITTIKMQRYPYLEACINFIDDQCKMSPMKKGIIIKPNLNQAIGQLEKAEVVLNSSNNTQIGEEPILCQC